jgi:GNAT superfamily N-acetyltransferase
MNMALRNISSRTTTPHIEVRLATTDDIPKLIELLAGFFASSNWADHMVLDRDKVAPYLHYGISTGKIPYVVAMDGDEMVGTCSYHTFDMFSKPMGVMDETYVVKRLRRTDLGRRLIALILALAKAEGCAVMNLPICSGMKEQNSLMNMVGRHFGAEPVGMIFRKVL